MLCLALCKICEVNTLCIIDTYVVDTKYYIHGRIWDLMKDITTHILPPRTHFFQDFPAIINKVTLLLVVLVSVSYISWLLFFMLRCVVSVVVWMNCIFMCFLYSDVCSVCVVLKCNLFPLSVLVKWILWMTIHDTSSFIKF